MRALVLALTLFAGLSCAVPAAVATPTGADAELWYGSDEAGRPTVRLFFFWTTTCPHCRRAIPFVRALDDEWPWLETFPILLTDRPDNVELYFRMIEMLGVQPQGVPTFLFCGRMEVGFDTAETTGADLRRRLLACRSRLLGEGTEEGEPPAVAPLDVPLLGTIDPAALSLPLFTVLIAALDAFNPCAFFVLMFLLSLLVHARDRRRMAVVGGLFVFTSGAIYFVFMAAWLNVFLLVGELRWVTAVAGGIAVLLALVNIKDYVLPGRGFSASIPDSAKPGLFARMRALTGAASWPALIAGTVTLAIAANSYELLCTAGFPMLFTRVLTLHQISTGGYYLYLVLYNVVYVVPLLGIATVFFVTLGSRKLQEREGRMLKLVSGLMMLGLGVVLLIAPEWLTDIRIGAAVIAAALAVAGLVALAGRRSPRGRSA